VYRLFSASIICNAAAVYVANASNGLPLLLLLLLLPQAQEEFDARRDLEVALGRERAVAAMLKETKVCIGCVQQEQDSWAEGVWCTRAVLLWFLCVAWVCSDDATTFVNPPAQ
jgi:hypothetical protein